MAARRPSLSSCVLLVAAHTLAGCAPAATPPSVPRSAALARPAGATKPVADTAVEIGVMAGVVGAVAGVGICSFECKEPWDTVVPVSAGALTLTALIVGAVIASGTWGAVR